MTRRAFLHTGATSTAIILAAPAWCTEDEQPVPTDADMLAGARDRIDRHRKGDASIRVEGAKGEPLAHVKVLVEQMRHDFLFGCNLFLFAHCGDADQEEEYRRRFAALFNYCTLGFYWASYESERGQPSYHYTDQVLAWTGAQGITCKGHPLVWDHPAGSPRWLPDDPGEMAKLVTARVNEIVSRYRGRIDIWDVVNEATHLPNGVNKTKMAAWGAALGPVPYVAEPLKVARIANPDATLLVNDYRTDPPYYQILTRERGPGGFLMDAVGIQSHMHDGVWPLYRIGSLCDTYGKLGLPIHFTETTIPSGSKERQGDTWGPTNSEGEIGQAEKAVRFYTTLFAHPAVQAVTWWDFSDYHAWQRAPAGLVRSDMSPKAVYDRLLSLIKGQWWTKTEGYTDGQGRLDLRGFYGRYRITAELSSSRKAVSEVHLQRGNANQFIVKL